MSAQAYLLLGDEVYLDAFSRVYAAAMRHLRPSVRWTLFLYAQPTAPCILSLVNQQRTWLSGEQSIPEARQRSYGGPIMLYVVAARRSLAGRAGRGWGRCTCTAGRSRAPGSPPSPPSGPASRRSSVRPAVTVECHLLHCAVRISARLRNPFGAAKILFTAIHCYLNLRRVSSPR